MEQLPETASQDSPPDQRPPRRARAAVLAVFFVNGAALGIWVPHIPLVQARLGLGPGALGLALLGIGAGSLLGMPSAGVLVGRWGSRQVTAAAALVFPAFVALPILAPSFTVLAVGLFLFGFGNGLLDVAMNTHAVAVEHRYRYSIMTSFHAAWSFGGLVAALVTGLAIETPAATELRVIGLTVPLFAASLLAMRGYLRDLDDRGRGALGISRPRKALLGFGLLALCALIGEGAMADWSAVYLYSELGAGSTIAAAGFAAFSLTMAIGRAAGDRLIRRFGRSALLRWSGRAGAAGMALALVIAEPVVVLIGFGLIGLGAANIVPILFTAAGQVSPEAPGGSIAAVAGLGYLGLLIGPVLIGSTAELFSLPTGLSLVALAYLVVSLGAHAIRS